MRIVIALDTNVLVRYLVNDNAEQAHAARELLESLTTEEPGLICREVMLELVWVLQRSYGFSRGLIAMVLQELAASEGLQIEAVDDVMRAALFYQNGHADFSDSMIVAAAGRADAYPLYTLDRKAARLENVVMLESRAG